MQSDAAWWDERYRHPNHVHGYRPNDFLVEAEPMLRRRSRLLVLGDGQGRNGVWLAGRGHQVTTVDQSAVGVANARGLAAERGVDLDAHVGVLPEWLDQPKAQGPWDGVVLVFCHFPSALRADLGRRLVPLLAPRGKLVMEEFTPAQPSLGSGGPTDPDQLVTREQLRREWPGLLLDVRLTERRIFEGMAHQGLCSVAQVLGQRTS